MRSLGYSIYYTIVNIGGAIGPMIAFLVRKQLELGIENVFRVAALSVFLMFWVTLFFYREPATAGEEKVASVSGGHQEHVRGARERALRGISADFFRVLHRVLAGVYFRAAVRAEVYRPAGECGSAAFRGPDRGDLLSDSDRILTRKMEAVRAIALGFLLTGLSLDACWRCIPPFRWWWRRFVVLALGEVIQASRYYEYISRLAPSGQQGLYMGYAFLPVAIGYFIAGGLGGYLLHEFGDVLQRPQRDVV